MQARDDPEGRTAAAGAPPPLERQGLVNPQRPQALNQRTPTSLLRTSTPIVAGEDDRPDRDMEHRTKGSLPATLMHLREGLGASAPSIEGKVFPSQWVGAENGGYKHTHQSPV